MRKSTRQLNKVLLDSLQKKRSGNSAIAGLTRNPLSDDSFDRRSQGRQRGDDHNSHPLRACRSPEPVRARGRGGQGWLG